MRPVKIIDAEVVAEAIVACSKCGQKNRLYNRTQRGVHRCAACRSRLSNPFPRQKRVTRTQKVFAWLGGGIGVVGIAVVVVLACKPDHTDSRPSVAPTVYHPPATVPLALTLNDGQFSSAPASPTPPTFTPSNNAILFSELPPAKSFGELNVSNGTDTHAVAKLINATTDRKVVSFFIRSGQNGSVGNIPDGSYKLLFTVGDYIFEGTDKFAAPKGFSRFDQLMSFTTIKDATGIRFHKLSVTLNAVPNGNAPTSAISETEFDRY